MTIKSLSSSQIALIMKKGRAYNSGFFLLKVAEQSVSLPPTPPPFKFSGSFVSSKKVFAKAVDRNRTRRRLKESFLRAVDEIQKENQSISIPYFVFISKKDSIKSSFADIVYNIKQIILKDYIIKQ